MATAFYDSTMLLELKGLVDGMCQPIISPTVATWELLIDGSSSSNGSLNNDGGGDYSASISIPSAGIRGEIKVVIENASEKTTICQPLALQCRQFANEGVCTP